MIIVETNGIRIYKIFSFRILTMETVLETQRRLHEERDRLIDSMTKEFLHERKSVVSKAH